ncbi:pentatricopeptide repeat-containing mitochondrial isoform B [Micractinium conductrix]|uniref:Pentatricopeptide repeat-containing mitochondrial isoform B n=1 Tax=Micractinium conductrix TaxID=554055 RepID=A0A2P6VET1_9CHLO|nr:pentatricopeptide repeat-containing mitochondrial isoform B [Micractinium conductrix]|eukprot:PSC72603.1 pentatricopeptide repeat-containing mitochondrial isoform B [Micractinium conductrix]
MTPERQAAFDDALGSGQLNAALAVLRQAAAAAPGGGGRLLGPQRNRALLQACFARGRPDLLVTYLTLVPPELAPWSAVLAECNRRQDLHTLKRVLAARRAAGLGLEDQRVATAAISGYAGAGRLSDALATFCRAWEEAPCRTVEVANAAISACANQGNWEAAQEVVALMRREGVDPDTITYNSLLKAAAAAGLLREARQVYAELLASGLRPSTFTYAALFNAAARARAGDAEWLLQTFDDMSAAGVEPNDYVLSALFAAASYASCTPAQLDRLFAALALLRSFGPANDNVYAAVLTLVQRQGIQERAVDVWTAVLQDGVRQTPHLFSSLFAACTTADASPALVDVAVEAAEAMQGVWRRAVERSDRRGPSPWEERNMLVAYNALLHFLGSTGALQRSLSVYRGMRRHGPRPDVVTYNTLMAGAAAGGGNVRTALRIFSDMVDADIEPTERTCGALLNCYAKARDAASARKVFDSLAQLGIRPNTQIYTSLIDACVQTGGRQWLELAFEFFEAMRAEGLLPSAVTYGCLMVACERSRDVNRAFELYRQACDQGIVPNDRMHDMLISMCTEAERLEEAVDLVKALARRHQTAAGQQQRSGRPASPGPSGAAGSGGGGAPGGGGLQEHTLNSLIRALCGKYVDRALRLLSLCQAMGMRPSRRTYLTLIAGCAKVRSQGMDADGPSASALIISLCQANQLDVAETVYNDSLACAWRRELAALPAPMARRGGLTNRAQLPDSEALASLVQAFAATGNLRSANKYYKQLRRSGRAGLAAVSLSHRRMWELLIENYCRLAKVRAALQVFDDWKLASDSWWAAQQQHQAHDDADVSASSLSSADGMASAGSFDDAAVAGGSSSSSGGAAGSSIRDASRGGVGARAAAARAARAAAVGVPPAPAPATAARYPKLSNVSLAFLEACCRREQAYEWRVFDVCAVMRQQKEHKRQAGLARPTKASHHFAEAA